MIVEHLNTEGWVSGQISCQLPATCRTISRQTAQRVKWPSRSATVDPRFLFSLKLWSQLRYEATTRLLQRIIDMLIFFDSS